MTDRRDRGGFTRAGDLLAEMGIETDQPPAKPAIPKKPRSKRLQNRDARITQMRHDRDQGNQDIGYLPKGFVLCGLPFKPVKGAMFYERNNGEYTLEITGSPKYGLPFGGDILPVIWVATLARKHMLETGSTKCPRDITFTSGAEILEAFGQAKDGHTYEILRERILRVFHATYFFGKANGRRLTNYSFRFFDGVDLWFDRGDLDTEALPGDEFKQRITLSEQFAREIERNPPPIDLQMARAWSDKPAVLFLGIWLAYRCFTANGDSAIPFMGPKGLKAQLGVQGYEDPKQGAKNFRNKVKGWLLEVVDGWPECPARIESRDDGDYLTISPAKAINDRTSAPFYPQKG